MTNIIGKVPEFKTKRGVKLKPTKSYIKNIDQYKKFIKSK